jgi:serpin B
MKSLTLIPLAIAAVLLGSAGLDAAKPASDDRAVVRGNTKFACDLYAQLRSTKGNLCFSPYSISTALAMTYGGARGDTAKEMASTLHFTLNQQRLHPAFARLMRTLDGRDKRRSYRLDVANALWGQQGYRFLRAFEKLNADNYGAGLRRLDFVNDREKARQTINAWVERHTNRKIKNLLAKGVLNDRTRLVLTNALYFKAPWQSPFVEGATKTENFHLADGGKVRVPLMRKEGRFGYLKGDGFQALELPYKGGDLSMVVFLPARADGLANFEKRLTAGNLAQWLPKIKWDQVRVFFPRFRVTSEFSLKKALAALGMKQAFSRAADFSGMTGSKELFISAVVHKTFVDVNEKGTEAAAATGVVVGLKGLPPPPKATFRADHPFVFLIRDNRSGSFLFLGRVAKP